MKIYLLAKKKKKKKDCGGYQKAKGHLDTQMYPECTGTKYDRNIVKKTVEERNACTECEIKAINSSKETNSKIFNLKTNKLSR